MRVEIGTIIPAPAELVWHHLGRPALLVHVAGPILSFTPEKPPFWPERWAEGDYSAQMRLLGLLPLGRQTVGLRRGREEGWPRTIRDDGSGTLVRRWDHLITVEPDGPGRTRYRDTVDIEAGLLTPFIWLFAQLFYRHRQRRWRALARTGFAALPPENASHGA
jgi:hypothetical protein